MRGEGDTVSGTTRPCNQAQGVFFLSATQFEYKAVMTVFSAP